MTLKSLILFEIRDPTENTLIIIRGFYTTCSEHRRLLPWLLTLTGPSTIDIFLPLILLINSVFSVGPQITKTRDDHVTIFLYGNLSGQEDGGIR